MLQNLKMAITPQYFKIDILLTVLKNKGPLLSISDIYPMNVVSRSRDKKAGHANSDTMYFLLRWIEITGKCTELIYQPKIVNE